MHDKFADFCAALGDLCGKELVLPMNTGAEAVETAIKVSRKWGYEVKGVPADQAQIIVASGNFHGRTTTIVGFSDDPDARDGFGPFTPGFVTVPYGDLAALEAAITDNTVAVLIEPIQGEGGVVIPPDGYLRGVREACTRNNVLFAADEIQAGLGRTGRTFACDHEDVVPDMYVLGKALGGGIVPVSAVVANRDVLGVLQPGQHGSTFGGNPLACAVGTTVVEMLDDRRVPGPGRRAEHPAARAARGDDRPRRGRRTRARAVGRRRHRPGDRHRPRGLRGADGPRRTRQGHPRLHDPARPAPGDLAGGPRSGVSTSWRPSSAADPSR